MTATTYADIRRRLAEATGPDRELDGLIAKAIQELPSEAVWMKENVYGEKVNVWQTGGYGDYHFYEPKEYTASLDAALALVEEKLPGTMYTLHGGGSPDYPAVAELTAGTHEINIPLAEYEGATPPLAVVTALFAALEAQHD